MWAGDSYAGALWRDSDPAAWEHCDGDMPTEVVPDELHIVIPMDGELRSAAFRGDVEEVLKVIAAAANIEESDEDGNTPLYMAACYGHWPVVQVLVKAGADINVLTKDGRTPLYVAAQEGHVTVVQALMAAGADTNAPTTANGATPLFMASAYGHEAVVRALVGVGADMGLKQEDGKTPLDVARGDAVTTLLREAAAAEKADPETPPPENAASVKAAVVARRRREKATKIHAWLQETCDIDDEEELMEILDVFVDPVYGVNSMARLFALDETDVDTILAPLPLSTRRLIKRGWLRGRPPK